MAKLYYEDVEAGAEVTPLVKKPTTRQLVRWAGASGDYSEPHYDDVFAKASGLAGVTLQGLLKYQFLVQMMVDWIGVDGDLLKISCQYRGMDFPGDTLTCTGKVTRKYVDGDGQRRCLECQIAITNQRGEKTTVGQAVAALPSRQPAAATPGERR